MGSTYLMEVHTRTLTNMETTYTHTHTQTSAYRKGAGAFVVSLRLFYAFLNNLHIFSHIISSRVCARASVRARS